MNRTIATVAAALALLLVGRPAPAHAQGTNGAQQPDRAMGSGGGMQGMGMQGGGQGHGMGMQGDGMTRGMRSQTHAAGNVASVDANEREITLDGGRKLKLTEQAQILEHGQQVSFDTIKPGDRVRASFDTQGDVDRVMVMHRSVSGMGRTPMQQRQRIHTPGTGQGPGSSSPEPSGSSGQTKP